MTTNQIRQKFLSFFASKGHKVIESDSLVPKNDPTVLFTTAGMQQFKQQFLGKITNSTRAATSQKCLRTDDLDVVGKTDFHHTFFEMLGNFSFGDYFKKEAIAWAWEFLTQELKLPVEKLWVSIYKDDSEAKDIWLKSISVPKEKIIALGDHSNFWPADAKKKGPNGPCGPCSEIFYDYGVNPKCPQKNKCDPSCDCGRFSEVWNLVFTQFNRKEDGVLEPLPSKNIDTGMGLERLAAVVQGKKSNFDTDIFVPIFRAIEKEVIPKGSKLEQHEQRIIADHIRAITFGIADGVVPSNEGRGYVIKRLIIDSTDIALRAGQNKAVIHKLVSAVVESMGEAYPEIQKKAKNIEDVISHMETSYIKVRKERVPELEKLVHALKKEGLPDQKLAARLGNVIFKFRDTYGLTIPTIQNVLLDSHISQNVSKAAEETFGKLMEQQQEKSRAGSKMTGDVFVDAGLDLDVPKTQFVGYEQTKSQSKILKLFVEQHEVKEAKEGQSVKVILDKTPFYAEAGGQIGDSGTMTGGKGSIRIEDTQKNNDITIHFGEVQKGTVKEGETVTAQIDEERRISIMRNHTATHLLQAALREVLGSHVQQQGSLVAEERLRFDFTHPKSVTKDQLRAIEDKVNGFILRCDAVTKENMSITEARKSGALAFFAEKYGDVVRVVSINGYSKEFCGGTHLDFTGQIGFLKITGENAIAQGIRRIEAKTGTGALAHINHEEEQLAEIAQSLKTPTSELASRIDTQTKRLKNLEKQLEESRFEAIKHSIDDLIKKSETQNGTTLISHAFKGMDIGLLRKVSDLVKQKIKSSVIVLGAQTEESASLLVAVSDDLVKKGIKANEIIKDLAPLINGSGGGRPELAQAGSRETDNVEKTIQEASKLLKRIVKTK